jgi:CRISPR type III-A-associated RAMP protein Csm4
LSKIRWKAAKFVPLTLIDSLLTGEAILADQWLPDPESGCLLRRDRPSSSPFRVVGRHGAAVDRLSTNSFETHSAACVEFEPGAGLWSVIRFSDEPAESVWNSRIQAAFRLLADSGFGGGRTRGWGQSQAPEFQRGTWPGLLLPKVARAMANRNGSDNAGNAASQFWLLSLYSPATGDRNDWSAGNYELTLRAGTGTKALRMVAEGSVIAAQNEPSGQAVDIAPEGFAHPVYRSGLALALELPSVEMAAAQPSAVEPALVETGTGCPPGTEPQSSDTDQSSDSDRRSSDTEPRSSDSEPQRRDSEPRPSGAESSQESDDDF